MGCSSSAALQQHHIPPSPFDLPQPLADSDAAEATRLVQGKARQVLREDAGLDGPDAGCLCALDETLEQQPADSLTSGPRGHVHAVLDHPGVDAATGNWE